MPDTFVVFYDHTLLVTLTGFGGAPLPDTNMVLDWYASNYAFERERLTGGWTQSVSVAGMKYEEFKE